MTSSIYQSGVIYDNASIIMQSIVEENPDVQNEEEEEPAEELEDLEQILDKLRKTLSLKITNMKIFLRTAPSSPEIQQNNSLKTGNIDSFSDISPDSASEKPYVCITIPSIQAEPSQQDLDELKGNIEYTISLEDLSVSSRYSFIQKLNLRRSPAST